MLILSYGRLENEQNLVFQVNVRRISIYILEEGTILDEFIKNKNVIQYLDHFIIFLPEKKEFQNLFWKEFYSIFGKDYEKIINTSNNIFCMNEMIHYMKENANIGNQSMLLDYGCGSGLSLYTDYIGRLVGYEPVYTMRQQALKRGMHVLGSHAFNMLPDDYFDAAFACYVFHLSIQEKSIYQLSQKMKKEAVLVANFYKDIDVVRINRIFDKLNYRVMKITDIQERFGSIYEYVKR